MGLLPEVNPAQPYVLPVQAGATTGHLAERLQQNKKLNRVHLDIVADFGADPTGGASAVSAIQAAIDAAQATVSGDSCIPSVYFPAGIYSIDDEIEWKSAPLIGTDLPLIGAELRWDGAEGGTAFTKAPSGSATGGFSYALMRGLSMNPGDNRPETWIDLMEDIVDIFGHVERVHFGPCTGDAAKVFSPLNMHWKHIRWDGPGGYAIRSIDPPVLGEMLIDKFTYDNNDYSGNPCGKGFLMVDNSNLDHSNIGTVTLRSGRVEINLPWTDEKAIVNYRVPGSSPNPQSMGLLLQDFTFKAAAETDGVLFNRDTADATGFESLTLINVRTEGLTELIAGNWPATRVRPPIRDHYGFFSIQCVGSSGGTSLEVQEPLFWSDDIGDHHMWRGRTAGDTVDRIFVDREGGIQIGDGDNAADLRIMRTGANEGGLAAGDSWKLEGTYDGGHLIMRNQHIWVDGSGRLRIKNGAPSSDTDGSVVGTQS